MLNHYYTPLKSIIKTATDIDEQSELTEAVMYDGNTVRIPTRIMKDDYKEVHIESVDIDRDAMAKGYVEMGKINLNIAHEGFYGDNEASVIQEKFLKNK